MEADELTGGPAVADSGPAPDPNPSATAVTRPGISPEMLEAAGVRRVAAEEARRLCGLEQSGLWIPYRTIGGKPVEEAGAAYGRLRLDSPPPNRGKYHQRAGSTVHGYIPPGLAALEAIGSLAMVEGEFKSLSLTEAGLPAMGISGFYGFHSKDADEKLAPVDEIAEALAKLKPKRILFFGDSDTTLNAQFADAACRAARLFAPVPVLLPRIPLDQPKGIDDCREAMGGEFPAFLEKIIADAVEVPPDLRPSRLACALLQREADRLKAGVFGMDSERAERRLIEIAAMHKEGDPITYARLRDLICSFLQIGKRTLDSEVKLAIARRRSERAKKAARPLPQTYQTVIDRFGPPLTATRAHPETGQLVDGWPAEPFWAGLFEAENDVLFEPSEKEFYLYHPSTGLWTPETSASLEQRISERILAEARDNPENSFLEEKRTTTKLGSIRAQLEGIAERRDAFTRRRRIVHCADRMISFEGDEPEPLAFAKEFYSRNGLTVPFDENADCPRFRNELLIPAVRPEDVSLLQRFFGMLVLQDNPAQRFMILDGEAGRGKTQLEIIAQKLVGRSNWGELRTAQLDQRFEVYRLARKSLLIGPDVPGDFLMAPGARKLKALVGGDALEGEGKNLNDGIPIEGRFNVLLTCNERLKVRLEGDVGAWRRRLLIVRFEMPPPKKKIENFAEKLFEEEGSGILNWAMAGAWKLLQDLRDHGDFVLTAAQRKRIDDLLDESDSLPKFCRERIRRSESGDLTKDEILEAYGEYCSERGWEAWPLHRAQSKLPEIMLREFSAAQSRSLRRNERAAQGYRKVELMAEGGVK